MFSIENSGMSHQNVYAKKENFRCGFSQSPYNFFTARMVPERFKEYKIPTNFAFKKRDEFIKLLLPDLASRLGIVVPKRAIMHEGYQLR